MCSSIRQVNGNGDWQMGRKHHDCSDIFVIKTQNCLKLFWVKSKVIYFKFLFRAALHLWIVVVIVLLCAYPSGGEIVPDHVGQGKKIVPGSSHVPVLDQREVQVPVEGLFH